MDTPSMTNWNRVDALRDEEIDTSDSPPLDEAFFRRARCRIPSRTVAVPVNPTAPERPQGQENGAPDAPPEDSDFKEQVDRGLKDVENGRTISHQELKDRIARRRKSAER